MVLRAGFHGTVGQPSAQVIDGSLKFDDGSSQYLNRTPSSSGNLTSWTFSFWIKLNKVDGQRQILSNYVDSSNDSLIKINSNGYLEIWNYRSGAYKTQYISNARFRDTSGWYNFVISCNGSTSLSVWANGVALTFSTSNGPDGTDWLFNGTNSHQIGRYNTTANSDFQLTQVNWIDGQVLDASYFGFTDPLTNTWKPKKYTGTFGTNGFYLPMDGNSPIGEDKSGNGNDWTPVNFGGSVALDNPQVSGARPILNTLPGGTQAGVGVFGSKENKYYTVTTANGSVYQFDITSGDNPSLEFIRGATYKFDYSSHTGHPVLFSSSNPDSSTTAYTTGTSIASNVISFTVPHDAPDTLYYYCSNHPTGMNGAISITTDETKADQYASNCTLALPLVGANSDVSASIACTQTNYSITSNGNASASSDKSNFYNGSFEFDGNGDSLTFTTSSDLSLDGDFTIEFWINNDTITTDTQYPSPITMPTDGSGISQVYIQADNDYYGLYKGSDVVTTGNNSALTNVWQHVAFTRSGSTCYAFLNGVLKNTATSTATFGGTSGTYRIGSYNGSGGDVDAYMQDLRIYKGVAKYTSNFVPAATNPDILPDTPSGVSGGSKLTISPDTSTEGAVVFDGDSDYLSSTGPGTLAASSNWCMECTFYCTGDASGTYRIMGANESSESSEYLQMRIRLGQYQFYTENANTLTGTAAFNKWTHMALTKSGTTVRAFVDGKELWSTTDNNADDITTLITGWGYGSEYFPGFISNARFVNGSSVYTSEFNPPVVPLTNITNTTHLFCQSNTSATAAAVGTITANGTAAASRFTPFNTDINTVRGQETGYATLNPLDPRGLSNSPTFSEGNLRINDSSSYDVVSTMGADSGRWYWEVEMIDVGTTICGIIDFDNNRSSQFSMTSPTVYYATTRSNGTREGNQSGGTNFTYTDGDTVAWALDVDNLKLYGYKNGVLMSTATITQSNVKWAPYVYGESTSDHRFNFGQKPFKYAPPDGFQPINAANIRPETVIPRPDQFVGLTTYTGSVSPQTVGGINFTSDLIWIKSRTHTGWNILQDSVRGFGKILFSNSSNAEVGNANDLISDVSSTGFSVNTNYAGGTDTATTTTSGTNSYVGWCWKAGGSKNTFNVDDVGYASASDVGMNVGGQNDNAYNKSQTWSSNVSGGSGAYGAAANAFNGNLSNFASPEYSSAMTYTNPSASDTVIDTFEIYGRQYSTSITLELNDTDIKSQLSTTVTWHNITGFSGQTFNKLYWRPTSGNLEVRIYAIKINGKILVDTSVTPPDAPSIAATGCSVGTKQGFSIIQFTNTTSDSTQSHGLTQKPDFIIWKKTSGTSHWPIYHSSLGATKYVYLNLTNASATGSEFWNNTEPSDSLVTTKGEPNSMGSAGDTIMYLWHDVPGLQKFGSYEGNNNNDGVFVELGFRPSILLIKRVDNTDDWLLYDGTRRPINVNSRYLRPNQSNVENTGDGAGTGLDLLSNGFKIRSDSSAINAAETYIYAAWAEAPSVDLYGGGANAR